MNDLSTEKIITELKEKIELMQTTLDNREAFIDYVIEHHPDVIKEYLKWGC